MPWTPFPSPQHSECLANLLVSRRNRIAFFTGELVSSYRRRNCKASILTFNRIKLHQDGYDSKPPASDIADNEPLGIQIRRAEIKSLMQDVIFLDSRREDMARQIKEMRVEELKLMAEIKKDNDWIERNRSWVRLDADKILRERGCFQRLRTRSISNTDIFGTVNSANAVSSTKHPPTDLSTENSLNTD